jgi:hypothetical protein
MLDLFEAERGTLMLSVPTMLIRMLDEQAVRHRDVSSWRLAYQVLGDGDLDLRLARPGGGHQRPSTVADSPHDRPSCWSSPPRT